MYVIYLPNGKVPSPGFPRKSRFLILSRDRGSICEIGSTFTVKFDPDVIKETSDVTIMSDVSLCYL